MIYEETATSQLSIGLDLKESKATEEEEKHTITYGGYVAAPCY